MNKQIFMIAGPNGAGKTTIAKAWISNNPIIYEFINADEIARGLAPLHPENMALTASKLMIKRFKDLLDSKKSFAFETTAAGTNYIRHLKASQTQGYEIHLTFLWLSSPELAIKRVAHRVDQGGHHIPKDVIVRRYYSGLKNLIHFYLPLADKAIIFDNSITESNKIIAEKDIMKKLVIKDAIIWQKIEEVAYDK